MHHSLFRCFLIFAMFVMGQWALAQEVITGRVVDMDGEPLMGAAVRNVTDKTHAVTDVDGKFKVEIKSKEVQLTVSYIGFRTQTQKANAQKAPVFRLEDENEMKEVVITGYQQLDRRNLTSSVTSKKMTEINIDGVPDVSKMLEGKIPDLIAVTNSGEVNATTRLRIRGTSTLVGNREPLWVLDGIILTDPIALTADVLNDPDYVNRIGNAIAGINPKDIERIDVLKDAAATALYGTRAANGVIVVTTKSGRVGKPQVSYTGQLTVRRRPHYSDRKINLMNSAERIRFSQFLAEQHYTYPTGMPRVGFEYALQQYYQGQISEQEFTDEVNAMSTMNTDWFRLLSHNSLSNDHAASVSGGSDQVRYYGSLGYNNSDDVINNTDNQRYTMLLKVDARLGSKFNLELQAGGYVNDRAYNASNVNPIHYAYNTSRAIPAYNADGSLRYYLKSAGQDWFNYNILNEMRQNRTEQRVSSATTLANLRYKPTKDLSVNAIFSATTQSSRRETWHGEDSFYASALRLSEAGTLPPANSAMPFGGELENQATQSLNWTARLQANWNKYLGEDGRHNLNISGGFEASSARYQATQETSRGYYKDRGKTFATGISDTYTTYWDWVRNNAVPTLTDAKTNLLSAYATVSWSYQHFFTLNANARYDGSNQFGSRSNEKLLPIWSVSGRADLLEILRRQPSWLNMLAFKASYGHQGNMLSNQTTRLVLKKGNMNAYYGEMTSTASVFANPDLEWEKTHSTNLAVEASFLKNRLQVELEYYHKKTTDAFMNKTISDINGYTSYVVNGGTLTNQGFNINITATPVRRGKFNWNLSGQLSKLYNKVHSSPGADAYELDNFLSGEAVVKGQPVGTFWSYRFLGLSPQDGGPIFDDWEERQSEIAESDNYSTYTRVLVPSGKREPDLTGSISNTFTWGAWRLGVSFLYSFGAKTRLFRLYDSYASGYSSEANVSRDLLDRWMKPGDEAHTTIPAIMGTGSNGYYYYTSHWSSGSPWTGARVSTMTAWEMYDYSTARVVSANYVKLSTLSLTYELPREMLQRLRLQRLAITASGYNLYTFCSKKLRGQTPTQGGFSEVQLSDTPQYTVGVTVDF